MGRQVCLGIACVALLALPSRPSKVGAAELQSEGAAEASSAAKANPELIGALSKELGSSPEQAAGAAGALFGVAKSRLKNDEFDQIGQAVPGMDLLLKAAPSTGGGGAAGALSQIAGAAGGLAPALSAFSKLGLKPELVAKAVPVLTAFVTKSGGANLGSLLANVLK